MAVQNYVYILNTERERNEKNRICGCVYSFGVKEKKRVRKRERERGGRGCPRKSNDPYRLLVCIHLISCASSWGTFSSRYEYMVLSRMGLCYTSEVDCSWKILSAVVRLSFKFWYFFFFLSFLSHLISFLFFMSVNYYTLFWFGKKKVRNYDFVRMCNFK